MVVPPVEPYIPRVTTPREPGAIELLIVERNAKVAEREQKLHEAVEIAREIENIDADVIWLRMNPSAEARMKEIWKRLKKEAT